MQTDKFARVVAIAALFLRACCASAATYTLGTTNMTVAASGGTDTVVIAVDPALWNASANAPWLHVVPGSESGSWSTNIVFAYDPNPGLTRTGTLTIAGFTVTVTQAGTSYVPASEPATSLVATGFNLPYGLAVDASGNVYIADTYNNAIKKYTPTNNSITTIVSSGLNNPQAVALDGAGNVYIADSGNNAIKVWYADTQTVSDLLTNGLKSPLGVAVDGAGNVYIADFGNNAVKEWFVATGNVTNYPIAPMGPHGIAVDVSGKIYYGEDGSQQLSAYRPGSGLVETLISTDLSLPSAVAVDGSGNVYVADAFNNAIKKWSAATGQTTTIVSSNTLSCFGVAIDPSGNVYVADTGHNSILELPGAFVSAQPIFLSRAAAASSLEPVLPATQNLLPPFSPMSDQTWLTVTGATNGVVSFSCTATTASRTGHIRVLGQSISVTQDVPVLSTTGLVEGAAAGVDSLILSALAPSTVWSAASNADWLHVAPEFEQGSGSGNVVFSFDPNPGATRMGTLTVAGQTVTVTQAGSSYVPAPGPFTSLVGAGLTSPYGLAVDGSGNVYIADTDNNAIKKWVLESNTVTNLAIAGLNNPHGVAVDTNGNVVIADTGNNMVKIWSVANGSVSNLVSTNLASPQGVALDAGGNIYIADFSHNEVKRWSASDGSVTTVVSGLGGPSGVALDFAGNVYIANSGDNTIKEWSRSDGSLNTLVSTGLFAPNGVAVDLSGNVYIADTFNSAIKVWNAASSNLTTVISNGLFSCFGVAVDAAANLYVADTGHSAIKELPRAFVDTSARPESFNAGTGQLTAALPVSENLLPPFAPTSDQSWLIVTGATNGVVSFSCTAATAPRTGHILLLGQSISVIQDIPEPSTTGLVEGPAAGADSLIVAALVPSTTWSAAANTGWLHVAQEFEQGSGSGKVVFSFDPNPDATRMGTLTVAGQTVTVTQAGSSYVPAPGPFTSLVGAGLASPYGLAVDNNGNVYIADTDNNAIKKWVLESNTVTNLAIGGLNNPQGVAVDTNGNVVIADTGNNMVKIWSVANGSVSNLVSTNLASPQGVALDAGGNIYIADFSHNEVKRWNASDGSVTTVVSGLGGPSGVALDFAGNVYIANSGDNTIKEWSRSDGSLNTLVSTGLFAPNGVAVDLSGNVYIADTFNSAIKVWNAGSSNLTTVISNGLFSCFGVAVDAAANLYVADTGHSAIKELPRAFVDTSARQESFNAGTDQFTAVLPVSENLLPPFSPTSGQPWLTVTGATNGVVSLAVSATTSNRIGNLTVLGQNIPVMQSVPIANPVTLTGLVLSNNVFSLSFTNVDSSASFTLLTTTNPALPLSNWTVLGNATNTSGNLYLFIDPAATGQSQYYRVRSP